MSVQVRYRTAAHGNLMEAVFDRLRHEGLYCEVTE